MPILISVQIYLIKEITFLAQKKLLSMVFTLSYITKLKQQYLIELRELKIKNGISVMRLTLIGVFINTTVFC